MASYDLHRRRKAHHDQMKPTQKSTHPTRIKITPEMIEAGQDAFFDHGAGSGQCIDSGAAVEDIYRAMHAVRESAPPSTIVPPLSAGARAALEHVYDYQRLTNYSHCDFPFGYHHHKPFCGSLVRKGLLKAIEQGQNPIHEPRSKWMVWAITPAGKAAVEELRRRGDPK